MRQNKMRCSTAWMLKSCILSLPTLARLTAVKMFCLEYLGMAAAIGYAVDIPSLIRVFACNAYQNGCDLVPLLLNRSFLELLDAGPSTDEDSCLAKSYELAWWTSAEAAHEVDVLSFSTMERCLAYHRDLVALNGINPLALRK